MTAELLAPTAHKKISIKIEKGKIPSINSKEELGITNDPHLQELITIFAKKFKNANRFIQAAELAYSFMSHNLPDGNNPQISQETAQDFYSKVMNDYEERRATFPLPVHYVRFEDPQTRSAGRIYKRDEGHHMLWPHMGPAYSHDSDLASLLTQFEDPAAKFGGRLVLTLKEMEIGKQRESINNKEPISIDTTRPRELRPNTPAVLSA